MQIGPARGETTSLEIVVTPEMAPVTALGGAARIYGTVALVEHMERVCGQLLAPHLEDGEGAIGHGLDLAHRHPVSIGDRVTLTATVAEVRPQRLKCEVMVRSGGRLVARGSLEQRVVNLEAFDAEVAGQLV